MVDEDDGTRDGVGVICSKADGGFATIARSTSIAIEISSFGPTECERLKFKGRDTGATGIGIEAERRAEPSTSGSALAEGVVVGEEEATLGIEPVLETEPPRF